MHTGCSEEQLMDCARLLMSFHSGFENAKLKVVYKNAKLKVEYSDPQKGAVAALPTAKNFLPPAAVGSF